MEEKKRPPEEIVGERIILRKMSAGRAREVLEIVERSRESFEPFFNWVAKIQLLSDMNRDLDGIDSNWEKGTVFSFFIIKKDTDEVMGALNVMGVDSTVEKAGLGYWQDIKYQGKGYMTEAIGLLEKELKKIGLNRIEITLNTKNKKSVAVALRCGYTLEAVLKDHCRDPIDGEGYGDTGVYAKFLKER